MFIIKFLVVTKRTWPNFNAMLGHIPDHRKRKTYEVGEILMAGIAMFVFKRKSRNHADKSVRGNFEQNYYTLWGLRLPILETVDKFLRELPPEEIEMLKRELVKQLLRRKTLEKWKFRGGYTVSVDGTGLMSFDQEPYPGCPYKTGKNGKKTWTAYVLEAKLCCGNGTAISLSSVWLDSSENMGDNKQDCELKAFKRLAVKLKKEYPRLPVTIVADSLYPNQGSFNICKENKWDYIFVLKDGSLKSVWEEINQLLPLSEQKENAQERHVFEDKCFKKECSRFINNIGYTPHHTLNWLEYTKISKGEKESYFAHVTNMKITKKNVWDISLHGRMRWIIENQGFNTQKNAGYGLQHKYSRKNYWAMKNYYQLLQIAHMISQLVEKLAHTIKMLKESGMTIAAAIEDMAATMLKETIGHNEMNIQLENEKQLRY